MDVTIALAGFKKLQIHNTTHWKSHKCMSQESLYLIDQDLTEVPLEIARSHGPVVKELNLSENAIRSLGHLNLFTVLETLVLDKNGIVDLSSCPRCESVRTLWLNNNLISELSTVLDQITACFPRLTMLSMMQNPASPKLVSESVEDHNTASRYRHYVIYRIPALQFLDAAPVTPSERAEARQKGKFLEVRRAKPIGSDDDAASSSMLMSPSSVGAGSPADSAEDTPGSAAKRKPSSYLGLGTSRYDGRHSEGNRFIVDDDL